MLKFSESRYLVRLADAKFTVPLILKSFKIGVGLVAQVLKPRTLVGNEGDEYITWDLFQKIKENSLLC